jgi:serine/threonine protein kinase
MSTDSPISPAVVSHNALTSPSQFPITALREIKLLKLLNHKNVLKLEDMAVEHPSRSSMLPPPPQGGPLVSIRC